MEAVVTEPKNRVLGWNETYEIKIALQKHIASLRQRIEEYSDDEHLQKFVTYIQGDLDDAQRVYDALCASDLVRVRVGVDV